MQVSTMIIEALAGQGSQLNSRMLLWRLALIAAVLGLGCAQTDTMSSTATVSLPSLLPSPTTQMAAPSLSPNATTTGSVTADNSSLAKPEMTSAVPNATWDRANTSAAATPFPFVTSGLPTATSVTTPTPPPEGSTPEQTTQPKATTRVTGTPSPKEPPTLSPFVSVATTTGRDLPTATPTGKTGPQGASNNVVLYLLLPVVVIAAVAVLVMIISCLRKRIRLDKLRHQLLPLYNFDPQEGEDWETELLTEPRPSSQTPLNTTKPLPTTTAIAEIPKLRFSPDTVDV